MSENDASRIVIEDSRVPLQIVATLTDNSRGIIYDNIMFIVHTTNVAMIMFMQSKLLEQNCVKISLIIMR